MRRPAHPLPTLSEWLGLLNRFDLWFSGFTMPIRPFRWLLAATNTFLVWALWRAPPKSAPMCALWNGEPQLGSSLCFCIAAGSPSTFLPLSLVWLDLRSPHNLHPPPVRHPLAGKSPVPPARVPQSLARLFKNWGYQTVGCQRMKPIGWVICLVGQLISIGSNICVLIGQRNQLDG